MVLAAPPRSRSLDPNRPTRLQRRVVSRLAKDAARLIPTFRNDLIQQFKLLGRRAEEAYRSLSPDAFRQISPGDTAFVDSIARTMRIRDWQESEMAGAYRRSYVRTLNATAGSINVAMGLAVNLPDQVGRNVVRAGGRRLGLVDIRGQSRTALFHALAEGREQGMAREQLARHIRGRISRGRYRSVETRAQVIARTETLHAQRVSSIEVYKRTEVVEGVRAFDAQIGATDGDCEDRNSRLYSFADADIETALEHPNGTLSWAPFVPRYGGTPGGAAPTPEERPVTSVPPRAPGRPATSSPARQPTMLEDDFVKIEGYVDYDDLPEVLQEKYFGATGGEAYEINRRVRKGLPLTPEQQQIMGALDDLAVRNPAISNRTLMRGEVYDSADILPNPSVGDIARLPQWTSTSLDAQTAIGHGTGSQFSQKTVFYEIRGTSGRSIVTNATEREVLLSPGSSYRVVAVYDDSQIVLNRHLFREGVEVFGDERRFTVNRHIIMEAGDSAIS